MPYSLAVFSWRFWDSLKWVSLVAHCLREAGLGVDTPEHRVREENEDRHQFENKPDIWIYSRGPHQGRQLPIEVKSKDETFGPDPDSWPERFEDVTLFNASKTYQPFAVILVSIRTKAMLGVLRDGTWYKSTQEDRDPARNSAPYPVLSAPRSSLLAWPQLVERLKAGLKALDDNREEALERTTALAKLTLRERALLGLG